MHDSIHKSLSESFFGKPIESIHLRDLIEFFSEPQTETALIEFKSGKVAIEKIIIEVCAFLNTGGGLLIIGSPEENVSGECRGELTNVVQIRNAKSLMQKLTSSITPAPVGVKIQPIKHPLGNAYLLEVPSSPYAPHQNSNDGKYYLRMHEEATFAPHELVKALFFKRQQPKLSIDVKVKLGKSFGCTLIVELFNETDYPTDRISLVVELFNLAESSNEKFKETDLGTLITNEFSEPALLKGLTLSEEYDAFHKNEPFLVKALGWSKEAEKVEELIYFNPTINSETDGTCSSSFLLIDNFENEIAEVMNIRRKSIDLLYEQLKLSFQEYLKERISEPKLLELRPFDVKNISSQKKELKYEVDSNNWLKIECNYRWKGQFGELGKELYYVEIEYCSQGIVTKELIK